MPHAYFCSKECSADIMTGILNRLSLLITSRYHAAVLSMESGVPIVAISMDERLDGIMKELSLDEQYLYSVSDRKLGAKIYRAIIDAEKNRQQISEHILKEREEYQNKLRKMGRFLKKYFDRRLR